ncbi:MAG: winged helix-turn-helix transcriptional regulator [Patescibacteria group bacterium]|nr:winged helix-turn-helix transcriptional regulator [Patescibacteria group bacterium]
MKNLWLFDEKRIAILKKLLRCKGAAPGCDLRDCLKVKKTLLSYHLGVLRNKGIVEETKRGRDKFYRIRRGKVPLARKVVSVVGE